MNLMKKISIYVIVISLYSTFAFAQNIQSLDKLINPSDYGRNNEFGNSIAIDGDTLVIGSPGKGCDDGTACGAAYVYKYYNGNFTLKAKLTALDSLDDSYFGYSVDISGDTIVIGAYMYDNNFRNSGIAYVFTKSGAEWEDANETAILLPTDDSDDGRFGNPVAINNDTILIGASNGFGANQMTVYLYTKPAQEWENATETARLTTKASVRFGTSLEITDDTIIVNAQNSAYIFKKPLDDIWIDSNETAKLTATDSQEDSYFGDSIAIDQDIIAIGATYDDNNGITNTGSVYVFEKPANGWRDSNETIKLMAANMTENALFGYSIDIEEEKIVIGSPGHTCNDGDWGCGRIYVYDKSNGDWTDFTKATKIEDINLTMGNSFGSSVGISGDIIVGSSPNEVCSGDLEDCGTVSPFLLGNTLSALPAIISYTLD